MSGLIASRSSVVVLTTVLLIVWITGGTAAGTPTMVVNVNSRTYGYDHPLSVSLPAGTYTVTPVGVTDGGAYNSYIIWSHATCTNPDGSVRTSPTTVTGWLNAYSVYSANFGGVTVDGASLDISAHPTVYTVDDGRCYPNALLALNHAFSSTFTTLAEGPVGFSVIDSQSVLWDNSGGMSLRIEEVTSTVPAPGAIVLAGIGASLVGGGRRRRAF